MRFARLTAAVLAFFCLQGAAQAAHLWEDPEMWWSGLWTYEKGDSPKFAADELSVELFGTYTAPEYGIDELFETPVASDGLWGGGAGLTYFLTREAGLGVDFAASEGGGAFVDQVLASIILRLPWERASLAPYLLGGGGRSFDPLGEWVYHGGLGIEWRPNSTTGIFIDGRYVWADESHDRLLLRAGIRLIF